MQTRRSLVFGLSALWRSQQKKKLKRFLNFIWSEGMFLSSCSSDECRVVSNNTYQIKESNTNLDNEDMKADIIVFAEINVA